MTQIDNHSYFTNPDVQVDGGPDTIDKVFLLSDHEIDNISFAFSLVAKATSHAIKSGVFVDEGCGNIQCETYWWLRSTGIQQFNAVYVGIDGTRFANGFSISSHDVGIRPAIWIRY